MISPNTTYVVKFWQGKYWRIIIAGLSYGKIVFVVEQYNNKLCCSGAVYVTIVHFEIKHQIQYRSKE